MTSPHLPLITPDLPGIGGVIKIEPEHFVVEEVPLYEATGAGDHLFARITRSGKTTQEVVKTLAAELGLEPPGIGYAGLKDKHAQVTQTFSFPYVSKPALIQACDKHGFKLDALTPHNKKLKPGHLLGNRFRITILHPDAVDPLPQAEAILQALQQRGFPNYFGSQRFGHYGDNAEQGMAILTGQRPRPRERWLHKLLSSAYQSYLFNIYLAQRIQTGFFDRLMAGDMAKKTDTGGMFVVEDVAAEQARFDRGEITFTGPLFGYKMRAPAADAAAFEADILATSPVSPSQWRQHRVTGNRRPGRLFLQALQLDAHPLGCQLHFYLPKGAYATVLLNEIMKTDPGPLHDV